jgi:hypothetical protein
VSFALRFWPYLAGAALLIGSGWYLHHAGVVSGHAASEAHWRPLFAAAERARDDANLAALRKEADSTRLSQTAEAEHAKNVASLNLRAADAEHRYASLLRQHSAGASCSAVREDGGPASNADAARESSELIDRTSRDFASLARRCESDAAALTDLQRWVSDQHDLFTTAARASSRAGSDPSE